MATSPAAPSLVGQQIPAPYPQVERDCPGNASFGFGSSMVGNKDSGNLGFATAKPVKNAAVPWTNLRKGRQ